MPTNVSQAIKRPCAPLQRGGSATVQLDSFILTPACPASVPAMSVKAFLDSANDFSTFDEEAGCEVSPGLQGSGLQGGFTLVALPIGAVVGSWLVGLLSTRLLLLLSTSRSINDALAWLLHGSWTGCVATICAAVTYLSHTHPAAVSAASSLTHALLLTAATTGVHYSNGQPGQSKPEACLCQQDTPLPCQTPHP
jgi:hypothetical protein